ncbi:MAG TPA: single-stranded DNA-binding protein [Stellaceae bacterium]|nr:single-stranded DNA-binding protein [Stellaceae bacterium]
MSGYLNRVQLIGNLGRDPEASSTRDGKRIVSLAIATGENWKDDRGNRLERTECDRVVIFSEGFAQIAEQYLQKGAKVFLEGKLTTRKWTDNGGQERYTTEIHLTPFNGTLVFLDAKRAGERPAETGATDGTGNPVSDDIPF